MTGLGDRVTMRKLRTLDFDVECRPLAWYGGDWVTKQPTVIAWSWLDRKAVTVHAIGMSDRSSMVPEEERAMLAAFRAAYEEADIVTGHFIRGFDLGVLSGALLRLGEPPLTKKLTLDTKLDAFKRSGVSMSQENLGGMYELDHPKVNMNTARWAEANQLLPNGIAMAMNRCKGDVVQHKELLARMKAQGVLRAPSEWSPEPSGKGGYTP